MDKSDIYKINEKECGGTDKAIQIPKSHIFQLCFSFYFFFFMYKHKMTSSDTTLNESHVSIVNIIR